eukprot:c16152_g1_i1 orf=191-682(+)
MYGNSGCIGIRAKASSDTMVERSSTRHSSRRVLRGHSTYTHRDWWATSSGEMENHAASRRPLEQNTPRSTPHNQENRMLNNDPSNTTFVNHALLLWEEQRRQWVGNKPEGANEQALEPVLSAETTYDDLLTTNRPFPRPVPLQEMMQFLVEIWIQEGLYDPYH